MFRCLLISSLILAALTHLCAQQFPDKIRGYKVQQTEIAVNDSDSSLGRAVTVTFGEPEIKSVSVTGINLFFQSELLVMGQSGSVDFITFKDFEVNGIKVEIAEFNRKFEFEKNAHVCLPGPIEVYVGTFQVLKGVNREVKNQKEEWRVRGRLFVFGKFRKFGFMFKRVVPVNVDLLIRNPLLPKKESTEPAGDTSGEPRVIEQKSDIRLCGSALAELG